ncbi:MAG: GDP-mannose 4,6-dehydratase [bacterium]
MKVLITGGAGFIGRWVVREFLNDSFYVKVIDNLSNSSEENIKEFSKLKEFEFIRGDIKYIAVLQRLFEKNNLDYVIHLAASINVQDSIDDPLTTFENDVLGTLNVLECCRMYRVPIIYTSTCLVYDRSDSKAIDESWRTHPRSPYSASKLSAEEFVISYGHSYNIPYIILRPFNTYGPYQRFTGEGGVIAGFIARTLEGKPLTIYGDGTQTRDFLFVEDCAKFIKLATLNESVYGTILNAGTGVETDINSLAGLISKERVEIVHTEHIHPQAEIGRLRCDWSLAKNLLGWKPEVFLEDGIKITEEWLSRRIKK